jgi:L-amino acid N-acyltransferase YncA
MLREANRDFGTRGRVKRDAERVAIVCDGEVVGFYTPHRAASGEQRIGPVYVRPAWRGRGLVQAVYRSISGPMLACIEDANAESIALHERAGFVRVRRYSHGWYWRRV